MNRSRRRDRNGVHYGRSSLLLVYQWRTWWRIDNPVLFYHDGPLKPGNESAHGPLASILTRSRAVGRWARGFKLGGRQVERSETGSDPRLNRKVGAPSREKDP